MNVSLNGEPKGDLFVELDEERALFFKVEDVVALKLRIPAGRTVFIKEEHYVPLSALEGVSYTFDENKLVVAILGKTTEKRNTVIELYSFQVQPKEVYYPRETSAFVNYGLTYAATEPSAGLQSFTASNKIGVSSGKVVVVSDSLYTKTHASEQFVRLFTNATYERRDDLQWFVLGDQFADSGDLGSSINMGGAGFSKMFKLDPYYLTQPLFNLQGVAVFPSQAALYMDGVLVGRQPIAPGTFDLKNIYTNAGSHTMDVVLTDPFGNEQKISYPLYFSPLLLREGLHEYSYHAGFIREQYGLESNNYGKPVFSAFHRYGVTSALNIGIQAEGVDNRSHGGITTSFLVPLAGAFALSLAESNANGRSGSAGSLLHSYQSGNFSTNLLVRGYSQNYAVVSSVTSTSGTKYEVSVGAGYSLPAVGGFSLGYSESETYGGVNIRVTSASYSRGLSRTTSLMVSAQTTRTTDMHYSLFVGLTFNLDKDHHGAAQYTTTGATNRETLQIQKNTPVGEGLGYQASLNRSDTGMGYLYSLNPAMQYNARYGAYSANSSLQNSDGIVSESYALSAAGSFVYAGGLYGFSRPISDSFSIVTVGTLPHAKVLNNGTEIGETGSSGMAVVPSLASYNQNLITLDMKQIPMDYSVSGVSAKISPSQWSGSCIAFDALKARAVTGAAYIVIGAKKLPLEYIEISMKAGDRNTAYPTGKGGEFYMENALPEDPKTGAVDNRSCRAIMERRKSGANVVQPGTYRATVDYEGGTCEFDVVFPATDEVITDLGDIQCVSSSLLL